MTVLNKEYADVLRGPGMRGGRPGMGRPGAPGQFGGQRPPRFGQSQGDGQGMNKRPELTEEQREMLTEQIWQISRSYATDPLLILAVVAQESRGNPNARGRKQSGAFSGSLGLMQIKLETAKEKGAHFGLSVETEEDLLRPEINVTVGTAYLIRLISKYGNWKDALIAYNLGHSAVDRMLESGKPLPTKYYEHVISKYNKLMSLEFETGDQQPISDDQ